MKGLETALVGFFFLFVAIMLKALTRYEGFGNYKYGRGFEATYELKALTRYEGFGNRPCRHRRRPRSTLVEGTDPL